MKRLLSRAWKAKKEKGIGHVVRSGMDILSYRVNLNSRYWYHRLLLSPRVFTFRGSRYHYFSQRYNTTWRNERAVEVPIIRKVLEEHRGRNILEVGNVISHYYSVKHDIVDKYEASSRVINQDIVDFRPSKKYDLIVSISTMEHVGWDEDPLDQSKILGEPVKILQSLDNLQECLAPGGMIIITIPVGYNPQLDKSLAEGRIGFSERFCLKRVARNKWVEAAWADCREAKYGAPYTAANAIVILFISKR
ncbi:MAG: class I SAM-dependent methyltransferase [Thermoplasmata archaeon]|nr:class I SAM-dependent methyltransferase [Thermoplasmata archaeon]